MSWLKRILTALRRPRYTSPSADRNHFGYPVPGEGRATHRA